MPIIINEVEIQVDEPPATQARTSRGGGDEEQAAAPSSSKVRPEEITAILRVAHARFERVRAD